MSEHCGTCSRCCKILPLADQPEGKDCKDCKPGSGCQIYADRPKVCRDFECVWLQSHTQRTNQGLPLSLRPDKCDVLMQPTATGRGLVLRTLPEHWGAWTRKPLHRWLSAVVEQSSCPVEITALGR
jgi:hypothetical protein